MEIVFYRVDDCFPKSPDMRSAVRVKMPVNPFDDNATQLIVSSTDVVAVEGMTEPSSWNDEVIGLISWRPVDELWLS